MKKTIIAVYGTSESGKSRSIKQFAFNNVNDFLDMNGTIIAINPQNSDDIYGIIQQGNVLIGISSQGDPGTGLLGRLEELIHRGCEIIICATRTRGQTVWDVDNVARSSEYNVIWFGNFLGRGDIYNRNALNQVSGNGIQGVVDGIINGTI